MRPGTGIPDSKCFRNMDFKAQAMTFPSAVNMNWENSPGQEVQESDCFGLLPLEIRFEVAYLLTTREYLSLRLVSKAMVCIFYAQEYWKSRYFIHRERGYLTYLLEEGCEDWLVMYHCTKRPKKLLRTLRYRRLQWLHNEWITDRCMMYGGPKSMSPENPNDSDGLIWDLAAGKIQCDRPVNYTSPERNSRGNRTCMHCAKVHSLSPRQVIFLSNDIVEIAVSVLAEDDHSFITGFSVRHGESLSRIDFGYQIPGKQININCRNRELRGFEVFAGDGGIQAVRPIFKQEGNDCNSVIGKPARTCYKKLLNLDGEVKGFAGDFDVSQIFIFKCSSSTDG